MYFLSEGRLSIVVEESVHSLVVSSPRRLGLVRKSTGSTVDWC